MNVSHSHRRTKKRSLPNLHVLTVRIEGKNVKMRLCTKCSRLVHELYPRLVKEVVETPKTKVEKLETTEVKSETSKEKEVIPAV